jgi:predicted phosphoadenosine phosphosulfate sulfurtransferase
LRQDEATHRRLYIQRSGLLHYNERRDAWQCCPLARWSVLDIWTYIHSNSVPYNAAYDVLTRIGIPIAEQRIGPFAVDRALGYGQLAVLRRGWPDLFNRFAARYPEARGYA